MKNPTRWLVTCALAALPLSQALAQRKVDRFGFVGTDGTVIPSDYGETGEFSEGLARVAHEKGGPYGFIDRSGKLVIKEQYKSASNFAGGVSFAQDMKGKSVIIDKRGKVVRELKDMYGRVSEYVKRDGPYPFHSGEKDGFMTAKGDVVIPATFDDAGFFSEGLAAVLVGGKIGFVDTTGKMVIAPQYYSPTYLSNNVVDHAPEFHEGLAPVGVDSGAAHIGFIDRTGKLVIPAIYKDAGYFSSGAAPVRVAKADALYGYIGHDGKDITGPKFQTAWDFTEGTAMVKFAPDPAHPNEHPRSVLIDSTGVVVLSVTGADVNQPVTEGMVTFQSPNSDANGIMEVDGTVHVKPAYESLWQVHDGFAKFRENKTIPVDGAFSGTHYIWYTVSQMPKARLDGGQSYYVYYAHVYGPPGLQPSQVESAVTIRKAPPSISIPKGSGSFVFNAEEIHKKQSSISDEALRLSGVMHGAYARVEMGTMKKRDTDSIWGENLGMFTYVAKP